MYPDTGGLETVGYGHLITEPDRTEEEPLNIGDTIETDRANQFFNNDVENSVDFVRSLVGDLPLSQDEFDAMVDLMFNVGPTVLNEQNSPSLNQAIQNGNYEEISNQLRYTIDSAGNQQPGLITRSEERRNLFRSE